MNALSIDSPVGFLTIHENNGAITALDWGDDGTKDSAPVLTATAEQLNRYFDTGVAAFDLPLAPKGTAFQKSVWQAIASLPAGETLSYGDIAKKLNTAARAVGTACGRNPIPIIIPCHRVLGANGKLSGYTGAEGIKTKEYLLALEGLLPRPLL